MSLRHLQTLHIISVASSTPTILVLASRAVTAVIAAMSAVMSVGMVVEEMIAHTIKVVVVAVDLQEGAEDAVVDAVAPPHGPMSLARFVEKRVIMLKIVGPVMKMMMAAMVTKKSMLPTGSTQIGTRTQVLPIISPGNSTISP
jgi:hypothetical protein